MRVNNFEPFRDVYGFVAGDDVLRFTAMLLNEVVDELGTNTDFIGHAGGDNFIMITKAENAATLRERMKSRFAKEVQTHYNFMDRQQGFMMMPKADGTTAQIPFMTLAMGSVSPKEQSFADIREITEMAAEARRSDSSTSA
jgi:GGDEF domain-containing protein